jgi:exodeoxyribonuclease V gamma subunit
LRTLSLFTASSKLAKSYTLQEWAKHLLDYAELLFPAESIEAAAQQAEKQQMNEIFLQLSEEFSAVLYAGIHPHSSPIRQ